MREIETENMDTKGTSLAVQAAERISTLIVEQHLTSKDKLPSESELAELLGVGRSSVREAVKLLVAQNVLEIRRGKGTYIAPNPGEVPDPLGFRFYPDQLRLALDLAQIRGNMEPWVARLAADQASPVDLLELRDACSAVEQDILAEKDHSKNDVRFHVAVAKCTHNLVVPKIIPIITYSVALFVSLTESKLRMETLVDHREIMDAICCGDSSRAEENMARHIAYNKALLEKMIENS